MACALLAVLLVWFGASTCTPSPSAPGTGCNRAYCVDEEDGGEGPDHPDLEDVYDYNPLEDEVRQQQLDEADRQQGLEEAGNEGYEQGYEDGQQEGR